MIRKATREDLENIRQIIKVVKEEMTKAGNPQWDSDYPGELEYAGDIERQELFVDTGDDSSIRGFMCLNQSFSKEYADAPWQTPLPAFCIHRLAVNAQTRGQGTANRLFAFAEQYAVTQGVFSMHIDTFSMNKAAQALFIRNGYRFVGEIYMKGRTIPYRCYEKDLREGKNKSP